MAPVEAIVTPVEASVTIAEAIVTPVETSVSFGEASVTLGEANVTLGEANVTLGEANVTLGEANVTLGEASVTLGEASVTLGEASVAFGEAIVTPVEASVTLGEAIVMPVETSVSFGEAIVTLGEASVTSSENFDAAFGTSFASARGKARGREVRPRRRARPSRDTPPRMTKLSVAALALAGALGLGSTGCLKQIILDGQIKGTRDASGAIDGFSDFEVARTAAYSGVTQFEGMHYLAPQNEDALFMLTKTWTSLTFAFIEDDLEQAEDTEGSSSQLYAYEKARAVAGYDRAIHYGIELLEKKAPGFAAAKKNDSTMKAWLAHFEDPDQDAENLFWTGYAWIAKTNIVKDEPAAVADLFIGVAMMERSKQLHPDYLFGSAHTILGAYHARSPMAEVDEAKKEFDAAIALTGGKSLLPKFQLAAKYYCTKSDKADYVKTLNEVIDAGDTLPEARLTNAIAKRKAKRYLGKERMMRMCGF